MKQASISVYRINDGFPRNWQDFGWSCTGCDASEGSFMHRAQAEKAGNTHLVQEHKAAECQSCGGAYNPSITAEFERHTVALNDNGCCKRCWGKPACIWCDWQHCTCTHH